MKRAVIVLAGGMAAAALVLSAGFAQDDSPPPGAPAETPAPPPEGTAPEARSPETASPETPPTVATVHVIAENIESDSGTVRLALCNTGLSVDGCPYHISVPAAVGFVEVTFENIPPGRYAVVGYQDLDDNDAFDMLLGVPREPYALSSDAADMLVPTFDDAAIELVAGQNDVVIRMKSFW